MLKIGVVTISDRASAGIYKDKSSKEIENFLKETITNEYKIVYRLIPDEQEIIEKTLIDLTDIEECNLIITTGGTGPAKRDVTPEATIAVCHKMMDGFGELMRQVSLKYVPTAILSRQVAGIREGENCSSLIINLPGKPKAIRETLEAVFPAVPYCIDLIDGYYLETNEKVIKAFRPKQ